MMAFIKNCVPAVFTAALIGTAILVFLPVPGAKLILPCAGFLCGFLLRNFGTIFK